MCRPPVSDDEEDIMARIMPRFARRSQVSCLTPVIPTRDGLRWKVKPLKLQNLLYAGVISPEGRALTLGLVRPGADLRTATGPL